MDKFTQAYIVCALWSANDEDGMPLDSNYVVDDIAPETLARIKSDCRDFQKSAKKWLKQAGDDAQNGHDYWLTRNGHGAGFWDRGYPKKVSDALCELSKANGEFYLYVGDDGKIYGE